MTKSVLDKLGYKPGMEAAVIGRPDGLEAVLPLPTIELSIRPHDLLLVFVPIRADVSRALAASTHYRVGDRLWFVYPKKSGRFASDIDRDNGWEPILDAGLIPVTQIAVDGDWSALRFRRRDEIKTLTRKAFADQS